MVAQSGIPWGSYQSTQSPKPNFTAGHTAHKAAQCGKSRTDPPDIKRESPAETTRDTTPGVPRASVACARGFLERRGR